MNFKTKLSFVIASMVILFNSCKNDLKILAPYKECVSVYGLLNSQEDYQYIRINKIFLGEGNAYQMAQVPDSINFQPGVLSVKLQRYVYGNENPQLTTVGNPTKKEIVLRDTVFQTQSGTFSTTQRLYYTKDKLYSNGDYYLTISNTHSGKTYTSKTTMVDSTIIPALSPVQPLAGPFYPVPYNPTNPTWYYLDYSNPSVLRKIRFKSVQNAREYQPFMRLHYLDSTVGGSVVPKYIDYKFYTVTSTSLDGGEDLEVNFFMSEFYDLMYNKMIGETNSNPNLVRRAIKMDFIVTSIEQNFYDFLNISAPSTSVAQDKPIYTNISTDGYGIFSSRSRYHVSKHLANAFIDYMASKKPTCQLNFVKSDGTKSAVCN